MRILSGTPVLLDTPPREPEWRSWLFVGLWSLVIFCTIPFARAVREVIAERLGLQFFLYTTIVVVVLGGFFAFKNLRARQLPRGAYIWLCAVVMVFIGYAYYLRDIPEEAIHVAQYGFLGLLVYRALVHRIRDYTIYLVATLIVGIIGIVDEYIQWVVPSRVFDIRDIRTNFIAGALAQVAIIGGLRPTIIKGPPSPISLRRLCYTIALVLFVLGLGYLNTPERVAWYATRVSGLSFLLDSKSMMIDYGYRYHDPEIGVFKSRFSHEQLKKYDQERGIEVAQILDRYIGGEGYRAFQKIYSVPRDAYAHEAGVHLFRRNRYLERATTEEEKRPALYTVALRENQILEKYFPLAIKNSGHNWAEEFRAEIDNRALKNQEYVSYVSWDLVTRYSERQVLFAFTIAIVTFLFLGMFLGERARPSPQSSESHQQ